LVKRQSLIHPCDPLQEDQFSDMACTGFHTFPSRMRVCRNRCSKFLNLLWHSRAVFVSNATMFRDAPNTRRAAVYLATPPRHQITCVFLYPALSLQSRDPALVAGINDMAEAFLLHP
jgi:hypothetical protein